MLTALAIFGICLSLALLMFLAYRGINVLLLASIMAMVAVLFSGGTTPLLLGTYTQLFMADVQRVAAAFDQPDLKAVFDVTVAAPAAWTVLGNGIATRTAPGRWRPISVWRRAARRPSPRRSARCSGPRSPATSPRPAGCWTAPDRTGVAP